MTIILHAIASGRGYRITSKRTPCWDGAGCPVAGGAAGIRGPAPNHEGAVRAQEAIMPKPVRFAVRFLVLVAVVATLPMLVTHAPSRSPYLSALSDLAA